MYSLLLGYYRWKCQRHLTSEPSSSKQDVAAKDSHTFDSALTLSRRHFSWSIFRDKMDRETLVKVLSFDDCTNVEKSTFVVCNLLGFHSYLRGC